MSKIGARKIILAEGVQIQMIDNHLKVSGPKGELSLDWSKKIELIKDGQEITLKRRADDRKSKAFHGLYWKLLSNMIQGVSTGFLRKLDFEGIGFRAEVKENELILNVGFSHPVLYHIPQEIEIKVEKNLIIVSGIDRQKVGQVAAEIRAVRPVEPYKGKGIKYLEEIPRRKPGKAAKAAIGGKGE